MFDMAHHCRPSVALASDVIAHIIALHIHICVSPLPACAAAPIIMAHFLHHICALDCLNEL